MFKLLVNWRKNLLLIGIILILSLAISTSSLSALFWFYLVVFVKTLLVLLFQIPAGFVQILFWGNLIILSPENIGYFFLWYTVLAAIFSAIIVMFIYKLLTFKEDNGYSIWTSIKYYFRGYLSIGNLSEMILKFFTKNPFFSIISVWVIMFSIYSGSFASPSKYIILPSSVDGTSIVSSKVSKDSFLSVMKGTSNQSSVTLNLKEGWTVTKEYPVVSKSFDTLGELFDFSIWNIPLDATAKAIITTKINEVINKNDLLSDLTKFHSININALADSAINNSLSFTPAENSVANLKKEVKDSTYSSYSYTTDAIKWELIKLLPNPSEKILKSLHFFVFNPKFFVYSTAVTEEYQSQKVGNSKPNINSVNSAVFWKNGAMEWMVQNYNYFILLLTLFFLGLYPSMIVLYALFYKVLTGKELEVKTASGDFLDYKFQESSGGETIPWKKPRKISVDSLLEEDEQWFVKVKENKLAENYKDSVIDKINISLASDVFTTWMEQVKAEQEQAIAESLEKIKFSYENEAKVKVILDNQNKVEEFQREEEQKTKEDGLTFLKKEFGSDLTEEKEDDTPEMKEMKRAFKLLEMKFVETKSKLFDVESNNKLLEENLEKEKNIRDSFEKIVKLNEEITDTKQMLSANPWNEEFVNKLKELEEAKREIYRDMEDYNGTIKELKLMSEESENLESVKETLVQIKNIYDILKAKEKEIEIMNPLDKDYDESIYILKKEVEEIKTQKQEIESNLFNTVSAERGKQISELEKELSILKWDLSTAEGVDKVKLEEKIKDVEEELTLKKSNFSEVWKLLSELSDNNETFKLKKELDSSIRRVNLKASELRIKKSLTELEKKKEKIELDVNKARIGLMKEDVSPEMKEKLSAFIQNSYSTIEEINNSKWELLSKEYETLESLEESFKDTKESEDYENLKQMFVDYEKAIIISKNLQPQLNRIEQIKERMQILEKVGKTKNKEYENLVTERIDIEKEIEDDLRFVKEFEETKQQKFSEEEIDSIYSEIKELKSFQNEPNHQSIADLKEEDILKSISEIENKLLSQDLNQEIERLKESSKSIEMKEVKRNEMDLKNIEWSVEDSRIALSEIQKDFNNVSKEKLYQEYDIYDVSYKKENEEKKEYISKELDAIESKRKEILSSKVKDLLNSEEEAIKSYIKEMEESYNKQTEITETELLIKKNQIKSAIIESHRRKVIWNESLINKLNGELKMIEEENKRLSLKSDSIDLLPKISRNPSYNNLLNLSKKLDVMDVNNPSFLTARNEFYKTKLQIENELQEKKNLKIKFDTVLAKLIQKKEQYSSIKLENKTSWDILEEKKIEEDLETLELKYRNNNFDEELRILEFVVEQSNQLESLVKSPTPIKDSVSKLTPSFVSSSKPDLQELTVSELPSKEKSSNQKRKWEEKSNKSKNSDEEGIEEWDEESFDEEEMIEEIDDWEREYLEKQMFLDDEEDLNNRKK